MRVITANNTMDDGPAIHPSWAVLHASDNTPAPITPVITCAVAVHIVPSIPKTNHSRLQQKSTKKRDWKNTSKSSRNYYIRR